MAKQRTKGDPIVFRLDLNYDLLARELAGDDPIHHWAARVIEDHLANILDERRKTPVERASSGGAFLGRYGQ